MKIIPSSKRHLYVAIVSIVLVVVALVVGMVSWLSAPSYDLTIASTAGGSVTTPGEGSFTYDEGTVVDLVAEADAGYHFDNWTGDVGDIADSDAAVTNITIDGDYSITAEFVKHYDLTISGMRGGLVSTPGEGTFTYAKGTVVNLVAKADAGYHFVNWTGDVDTIGNVNAAITIITTNGNYSIRANFVALYDLTIASAAWGSVITPREGPFTYDEGTVVDLVAEAYDGYQFVNWTGEVDTITDVNDATTTITMDDNYSITANFQYTTQVTAGGYHTVGLKADGTLFVVGNNDDGQCNIGGWTNVIHAAVGYFHTVGLKADGTVVAVGSNSHGQCNIGGWTDIIHVAAGAAHTVGIKADGTVVADGDNDYGQCNVGGWTDITHVAAGAYHTVGLKDNGTVVAVGENSDGQCNISGWTHIIQVAAGGSHTVGLESDATVAAVGYNYYGQCDVSDWDLT